MKKAYSLFGILAPIFYILAVVIGGAIIKGYSHTYNTISELTVSNITPPAVIQILFIMYNLCLVIFGIGNYQYLQTTARLKIKLASILLIAVGIIGCGMYFFPQDPRSGEMHFGGQMHIALASMASLFTMLSMLLAGAAFKGSGKLKGLRKYSYISCLVVFITGGIAAASVANNSSLGGLIERFTIGAFIQWVLVVSVTIFLQSKHRKNQSNF